MRRPLYTGIDIGSHSVKVVIAAPPEGPDAPLSIIGTGSSATKGMRQGYVTDRTETTRSIREAVARASQASKVSVKRARVAIGGVSLEEMRSTGDITLTTSGGVVSERDIERALKESEKRALPKLVNRTIIHTIPLEYRLDGAIVRGRATGLQGTKFAVDSLIISVLTQHYDDIIETVEAANIEVEGVMASPLAASFVTLTKAQKTAGAVLANIGAETLSLIVYDNDLPMSIKIFSTGSSDITHAIALAFQLPLAEAEQLKRGAVTGSDVAPRKMTTVMNARLKEMFALIDIHLKSIGRSKLLPAGIFITGGGASLPGTAEHARAVLKLPAQVALPAGVPRLGALDATWSVAYGLCRWGYTEDAAAPLYSPGDIFRKLFDSVKGAFRALLP